MSSANKAPSGDLATGVYVQEVTEPTSERLFVRSTGVQVSFWSPKREQNVGVLHLWVEGSVPT